jgi:hypothetical protein
MVKYTAESCLSGRDVLRSVWLSCGNNLQRRKRSIVYVVTDPMVTAWEGNEISDYMVH